MPYNMKKLNKMQEKAELTSHAIRMLMLAENILRSRYSFEIDTEADTSKKAAAWLIEFDGLFGINRE